MKFRTLLFSALSFFAFVDAFSASSSYNWTGPTTIPDLYPAEGTLTAVVSRISSTQFSLTVSGYVTKNGSPEKGRVDVVQAPNPSYGPSIEVSSGGVGGSASRDILASTFTLNFYFVGGSTYLVKTITGLPFPAEGGESQTVTISPTSFSMKMGETKSFTASGGHNGYDWSVSGGGGLSHSGGSTAVFTASTVGTWTISVFSPSDSSYAKSNTAASLVTVTLANRVRVSLKANNGSWPVEYVVMQDGEEVATYVQMPGASARIISQVVSGTGPVTVLSRQVGLNQEENGNWTVNPDGAGPVSTSPEITPEATEEPPAVEVDAPPGPTAPAPTQGEQSDKPVWSSVAMTTNTDPNNQTDLVTNSTFREGVDKIAEPLNWFQKAWKKAKEDSDIRANALFGSGNMYFSEAEWLAAKARLEIAAATNMSALTDKIPTSATVTPFTPGTDEIELRPDFVLKAGTTTIATLEFKPFKLFPWLKTGLLVIREIILWGMGWMFYAAAQAKLERIQFALSLVPQADVQSGEVVQINGSQYPGSSTAIALGKRVLVAGAIIGVIHIELAGLIVVWNTRIGEVFGPGWSLADVGNIANVVNSRAGGFIGTAARIMDTVFPLTAGVAFIVAWFLFSWACIATYAAASAAAKSLKV